MIMGYRVSADAAQLLATKFSSSTCGSGFTYTAGRLFRFDYQYVCAQCDYEDPQSIEVDCSKWPHVDRGEEKLLFRIPLFWPWGSKLLLLSQCYYHIITPPPFVRKDTTPLVMLFWSQFQNCKFFIILWFQVGHNYGCQHDRDHGDNSHYEYGYGWFIGEYQRRSNSYSYQIDCRLMYHYMYHSSISQEKNILRTCPQVLLVLVSEHAWPTRLRGTRLASTGLKIWECWRCVDVV